MDPDITYPHPFSSTAPTGPPTGVNTTTSGSSITVHWSPVPCLQRNSQITGYVVRYTDITSSIRTSEYMNVSTGSASSTILTGLKGFTRYSIEIAAIGAGEMGVFSSPLIADASEPLSSEVQSAVPLLCDGVIWAHIVIAVNGCMCDWI